MRILSVARLADAAPRRPQYVAVFTKREWSTKPLLRMLGWTLQFAALVMVGTALLIGLLQDALRAEIVLLAAGGGLFLLGRWLARR